MTLAQEVLEIFCSQGGLLHEIKTDSCRKGNRVSLTLNTIRVPNIITLALEVLKIFCSQFDLLHKLNKSKEGR